MTLLLALKWGAIVLGGLAALYGLHRLALWLEARGHLFYLNKKPEGGMAKSLSGLEQFVEPQAKHVHHVREQKRHRSEGEGGGAEP